MFQARPGPGNIQSDTLFVLLGDGQALAQTRSRECPGGEPSCDIEDIEAMPWSVDRQRRCNMGATYTLELEDCVTAEYSCDEVNDILEGVGGAGGAGGSAGGGGDAGGGAEAGRAGEFSE